MRLKLEKTILVAVGLLLISSFTLVAEAEDWRSVVQFQMGVYQHKGTDYSRTSLPYEKHVTLSFKFKNLTSSKQIRGISFRARFLDSFNDVLHTTEALKLSTSINPGDAGGFMNTWYYENQPYENNDPYDKLAPAVQAGNLKARVDFLKVALQDGTVWEYPEIVWQKGLKERKVEKEWAKAFASWEGPGTRETSVFGVDTEKWKVGFVAFDAPNNSTLEIDVYKRSGELVKRSEFDLSGVAPGGDMVFHIGPGKYYLQIGGSGAESDWNVYVHEPQK